MTKEGQDAAGAPTLGGTSSAIKQHWDNLVEDMAATADEFRDAGWEVLELHPGDVTVVTETHRGFDVLVPDDEFETLREWIADASFPEHDVYRADRDIVFLLVVLQDPTIERAVCCPLYYDRPQVETLSTLAAADGELRTHVRRLSEDYVHLRHEDPDPFLPDD